MNAGKRPSLVIFDMDDVLCRYDLEKRLSVLSSHSGVAPETIRKAIWDSGFEDRCDAGLYTDAKSYLDAFCHLLGARLTRRQWIEARRAAMVADKRVLDLVRSMKGRTELALFTNNGPLLKETLPEIMPVFRELFGEHLYCSYEFGAKKPDPETYTRLLAHLGCPAEDAYYIDDKKSNAEGAEQAGLRAYTYSSYTPFEREVRALGLLD